MDTRTHTDWLTATEIIAPLRRMAGKDAEVTGTWKSEHLTGGHGETLGVWRVVGAMATPDGERPWSMVLKGWVCDGPDGSPTAFNWPWREAALYQSHMLEDLPGVSAPTCYGSVEREGTVWVWLEDLTGTLQPVWTVERFATAARLLGRMNGAYLAGRPLPDHPGLSQQWLEGWSNAGAKTFEALDDHLRHPVIRAVLPPEVVDGLGRIWDRRGATLTFLRSLPQTFSHLDAFPRNIFFRQQDGHEDMVLIDWTFAGLAAPGEELAALCVASAILDPRVLPNLDDVERATFGAYLDGLREAGWQGAEMDVWRAYRSSALLRYGPAPLRVVLPIVADDVILSGLAAEIGVTPDSLTSHFAAMFRWLATRADET